MVGNGNVAADVARMLALTREELAATDVADHALEVLADSNVHEIVVLGRRGPAQAAFTNPELLELGELTDADVIVDPGDAELDPLSRAFIESEAAHATAKKNVEILHEYSKRVPEGKRAGSCCASSSRRSRSSARERVEGIRIVPQRADRRRPTASCARARARPTEEIECGLVFRSIGYRGTPLEGLPFDERRAVIPNDGGRVLADDGPLPGEYVVGWIKRGPDGHHRHQQARRPGDGRHGPRGSRRGPPAGAGRPRPRLARRPDRRAPARRRVVRRLAGDRRGRALGRRAPRPAAREAVQLRGPARGLEGSSYAGALTLACSPSSASRARSTDERMQVKIGVSEAV